MAGLERQGRALAEAIVAALPGWVERSVGRLVAAYRGESDADVAAAAREAGERAATELGPQLRALLGADVDEQRTTPLALVRSAVGYPAAVLRAAGVPPVERDRSAEELFPEDDYDLMPGSLADLDPALGELALSWGAAKAWEHRRRHSPGDST